jgi:DNA-directed RNA polymerase omega subunit
MNVVQNRFDLVILAARRTRQLLGGQESTVPIDRDKPTVVALREIAEQTVSVEDLYEAVIAARETPMIEEVPYDDRRTGMDGASMIQEEISDKIPANDPVVEAEEEEIDTEGERSFEAEFGSGFGVDADLDIMDEALVDDLLPSAANPTPWLDDDERGA